MSLFGFDVIQRKLAQLYNYVVNSPYTLCISYNCTNLQNLDHNFGHVTVYYIIIIIIIYIIIIV